MNNKTEKQPIDTRIPVLGEAKIPSAVRDTMDGHADRLFVSDKERVLLDVSLSRLKRQLNAGEPLPSLEKAGPRRHIYFDRSKVRCAMVTCGGLCPGLNDIIRSVVLELYHGYGVERIYGIRYGLEGFIPAYGHEILDLRPDNVHNIHEMGGTILGSSRGHQSIEAIVDSLERMNIGILFTVGGGGTLEAATKIADIVQERKLKISIVAIPKTIDNDIYLTSRSFGFDTAVEVATKAIRGAHNEAEAYPNGVGLIKLMGRHSGFIAATAALAQPDVNFVLIPEVDFDLSGPGGLLPSLEQRLSDRGHAVIVVAEGAGQKFFKDHPDERDKSGNVKLGDIGLYLKKTIKAYFDERRIEIALKYIDPSYMIRSLPANAYDNVFCSFLGRDAVHAALAGKTKLMIGYRNDHFVHIPMQSSAGKRKQVDPRGKLWQSVLESTGMRSLKRSSSDTS